MLLSELLVIYGDIYKGLAMNFDLARKEPDRADYYYKNAIIGLMDTPLEIKLILENLLIYPVYDVYVRSIRDSTNTGVYVLETNKIINDYVIKNEVDLTEFVNSVSWDNGFIPFDWVMISKENAYDTTNWNADFGEYLGECDPYLWINNTPPYVKAIVTNSKTPLSSININRKYRLIQDPLNINKFAYNDGSVIIEYEVFI
jgi:hypothetical protein